MALQVPLEALSAELEGHLQVLRHRLVEVINEHYADFVSLSSKLVNVDSAVLRMQKPLLEVQVNPIHRSLAAHAPLIHEGCRAFLGPRDSLNSIKHCLKACLPKIDLLYNSHSLQQPVLDSP